MYSYDFHSNLLYICRDTGNIKIITYVSIFVHRDQSAANKRHEPYCLVVGARTTELIKNID